VPGTAGGLMRREAELIVVGRLMRRVVGSSPRHSIANLHEEIDSMAQKKPTVYEFVPKLGQLRDDVLFGDVWEHPDLSKRDRSLITVAMLAALYRTDEMRGHMQRALDNGVTETELKGLITHVAFYAGWPCAVNAGRIAIDVFGPK
jgi:4-carboxymuconolactone decarboxylase